MKSPYKLCELDPIPTWLLKCCLTELLPLITTLVNKSLTTGSFPGGFKLALIKPHLKKQTIKSRFTEELQTSVQLALFIKNCGKGCDTETGSTYHNK